MLKKITLIALSLALLIYPVEVQRAHTLNVFPTGEDMGGAQMRTPPGGVEILNNSKQPPPLSRERKVNTSPAEKTGDAASNPRTNPVGRNGKSAGKSRNETGTTSNAIKGKRAHGRRARAAGHSNAMRFAGMETRKRNLIRDYYNRTGRALIITSAYRPPARQARAIFKNLRTYGARYVISHYRRKSAIREIVRAYRSKRRRPQRALIAMTRVIEAQVKKGVFVSKHMLGRAFDVRSRGRNGARLAILREVARSMGGKVVVEDNHYHVEL